MPTTVSDRNQSENDEDQETILHRPARDLSNMLTTRRKSVLSAKSPSVNFEPDLYRGHSIVACHTNSFSANNWRWPSFHDKFQIEVKKTKRSQDNGTMTTTPTPLYADEMCV
jgi:hypothetical protein